MLLITLLTLLCGVSQIQAKAVFAHFMVGNTESFDVSDWQKDITLARDAHIDGFALNMANGEKTNGQSVANAFAAAVNLGSTFKLFFSFDFAGNGSWPQATVISMINQYKSSPAYYIHNSKPLVSTFEGVANASNWTTIKSLTGCFFIPSFSSLGAKNAVATGVVDGLFSWAGWPEGPNDMYTDVDQSYRDFLKGAAYMMPVSPWFYTNMPGFRKNWLWRGDNLWFDRWQQVNYVQPEFVQIISWNDFGESHHIGPLNSKEYVAFGPKYGNTSFNYALDLPHDGWRLFLPYMIDLYKYNTSSVTREGLVSWYRPSLSLACASGGTTGNTASQLQRVYQPQDIVQDRIFFSALLGSTADITVTIGGTAIRGEWVGVPDGGVGVYHSSIPISGRTGAVSITLARSGTTIASITGRAITNTCANVFQNWNAWVGSAISVTSIPAKTPPRRIENQVCVKGTAPGNYKALCEFSCQYGYCPSVCTCRALGLQKILPTATGQNGCPKAGFDVTFLGLCSFACNRGYCPADFCVVKAIDFKCTAPLPVPPPVPACIYGTGVGQFADLCWYTCVFGFCPPEVCTCLNAGPRNAAPPVIGGKGLPLRDIDYGLCDYTCTRGYCPSATCYYQPPNPGEPNVQRYLNPYLQNCTQDQGRMINEAWSDAALMARLHYQWRPGRDWQEAMTLYLGRESRHDGTFWTNGPLAKNIRRQYEIHEAWFGGSPRWTYAYFYCFEVDLPISFQDPNDPLCGADANGAQTIAYTFDDTGRYWTNHYVMFCPAFFDENYSHSLATATADAIADHNLILQMSHWAETRAVTLFHETYHWNNTVSVPHCGLDPEVYDVDEVIELAEDYPEDAAINAENWALAAVAIYVQNRFQASIYRALQVEPQSVQKSKHLVPPKTFCDQ